MLDQSIAKCPSQTAAAGGAMWGMPVRQGPVGMSIAYIGCITIVFLTVRSLRSGTFQDPHCIKIRELSLMMWDNLIVSAWNRILPFALRSIW